jgi:hypothetical protein
LLTNKHCLFSTFEEAKLALEAGKFEGGGEPGPYRIIAVYTVNRPNMQFDTDASRRST